MKLAKCWNCGARFARVDGLELDDFGHLRQLCTCPRCGRWNFNAWRLGDAEKIALAAMLRILFGDERPVAVRRGVALFGPEPPKPAGPQFDQEQLERFFAEAAAKRRAEAQAAK